MSISDEELKQFDSTIGIERLKSFANHNSVLNITELLDCYINNIRLSQAFYPILSILEIRLRNSINTMLKTYYSPEWLEIEYREHNILLEDDYNKLINAYDKIQKNYNLDFSFGKVLSELNFGFWTNLCSKKYNAIIWTKKGRFKSVFINYPADKQQQIHNISHKLDKIRRFRNRIFHYEPILKDDIKIQDIYNRILEILGYLPQDPSNMLKTTDNFRNVYTEICKKQLKT